MSVDNDAWTIEKIELNNLGWPLTGGRQEPVSPDRPEVEMVEDNDTMAVFDPDNMNEAWVYVDTVAEVVR